MQEPFSPLGVQYQGVGGAGDVDLFWCAGFVVGVAGWIVVLAVGVLVAGIRKLLCLNGDTAFDVEELVFAFTLNDVQAAEIWVIPFISIAVVVFD